MRGSKKKTKAGPNIFDEVFLHEEVSITISMLNGGANKYVMKGMLIAHDSEYYYLGDPVVGIAAAVTKDRVYTIELLEDEDMQDVLDELAKPGKNGGH